MVYRITQYYNSKSQDYEKAISRNAVLRFMKEVEKCAVFKLLSPKKNENILDAGSGPGIYAAELERKGCHVLCVDISRSMCEMVNRKRINNIVADIEKVNLNEKFDKIICLGVLEFVNSPLLTLINLRKYLKESGFMIILIPRFSLVAIFYKLFHLINKINIKTFSFTDIRYLLEQSELKLLEVKIVFGYVFLIKACLAN